MTRCVRPFCEAAPGVERNFSAEGAGLAGAGLAGASCAWALFFGFLVLAISASKLSYSGGLSANARIPVPAINAAVLITRFAKGSVWLAKVPVGCSNLSADWSKPPVGSAKPPADHPRRAFADPPGQAEDPAPGRVNQKLQPSPGLLSTQILPP